MGPRSGLRALQGRKVSCLLPPIEPGFKNVYIKFVFRDSGPLWLVFPVQCVDIDRLHVCVIPCFIDSPSSLFGMVFRRGRNKRGIKEIN